LGWNLKGGKIKKFLPFPSLETDRKGGGKVF